MLGMTGCDEKRRRVLTPFELTVFSGAFTREVRDED
jgi:hypothetical protein